MQRTIISQLDKSRGGLSSIASAQQIFSKGVKGGFRGEGADRGIAKERKGKSYKEEYGGDIRSPICNCTSSPQVLFTIMVLMIIIIHCKYVN